MLNVVKHAPQEDGHWFYCSMRWALPMPPGQRRRGFVPGRTVRPPAPHWQPRVVPPPQRPPHTSGAPTGA